MAYRKLNLVTQKDAYPIPRIDDTLDTQAGSQWFSTLDMVSGYWQVEVGVEDREKTAFCTPNGLSLKSSRCKSVCSHLYSVLTSQVMPKGFVMVVSRPLLAFP